MKINQKIQKIGKIVLGILLGCGTIFALGFVAKYQSERACNKIILTIDDTNDHHFLEKDSILKDLNKQGKIIGKQIGKINTSLLEKIINSNAFVRRSEVYSSIEGNMHVNIWQREPIVRIINMKDEQFYIDSEGEFMPLSDTYTPEVIVANGFIFNGYSEMRINTNENKKVNTKITPSAVKQVYVLAKYLSKDTFWMYNAEQIYVNEFQELELIPRVGDHKVVIGDTTNLEDKFNRLYTFYQKGLSVTGWNNYSIINLKFKDQVVCTKIKK